MEAFMDDAEPAFDGVDDYVFSIHNDEHKLVVGLGRDGSVKIGPGATGMNEAALAFYQAVAEIIERMDAGEEFAIKPSQKPS